MSPFSAANLFWLGIRKKGKIHAITHFTMYKKFCPHCHMEDACLNALEWESVANSEVTHNLW